MNRITTFLIKVIFTCLLLSFVAQCCAATTVSITDITAEPGDTINRPLMINDITDYGTGTINITYDPSMVHVTGVTDSPDSTVAAFNNNNDAGFTVISASNVGGASGNIVFANVEFTAVGAGGDSTQLNININSLYNRSFAPITATIDNGLFTISGDGSTSSTHTTPGEGGATDTLSIPTPTSSPISSSAPAPTSVQPAGISANPVQTSESTPQSEETDTSGDRSPDVKPTPNSQMSTPGFEAVFVISGLVVVSLIQRRAGNDD